MNLNDWVKQQRGRSLSLALCVGVTPPVVSDWCTGKKAIAAEHCKTIERFTDGEVTVQDMRPNDWHKYWPELAQYHASPAQAATETVAPAA
jgi:DNA-binding transcriptional regulator YdaS (Cro superfamily)